MEALRLCKSRFVFVSYEIWKAFKGSSAMNEEAGRREAAVTHQDRDDPWILDPPQAVALR